MSNVQNVFLVGAKSLGAYGGYAYFHGHTVGGTNPSLIEALGSTDLNLLVDIGFNREVAEDCALYWSKELGELRLFVVPIIVMCFYTIIIWFVSSPSGIGGEIEYYSRLFSNTIFLIITGFFIYRAYRILVNR